MLAFIKMCFFTGLVFLSTLTGINSLSCISMNNQECKVRPQIVNVNEGYPVFFPYSVKTSKCSGSCNNTNNPLAKLCVPDVVKYLNVKLTVCSRHVTYGLQSEYTLYSCLNVKELLAQSRREI